MGCRRHKQRGLCTSRAKLKNPGCLIIRHRVDGSAFCTGVRVLSLALETQGYDTFGSFAIGRNRAQSGLLGPIRFEDSSRLEFHKKLFEVSRSSRKSLTFFLSSTTLSEDQEEEAGTGHPLDAGISAAALSVHSSPINHLRRSAHEQQPNRQTPSA